MRNILFVIAIFCFVNICFSSEGTAQDDKACQNELDFAYAQKVDFPKKRSIYQAAISPDNKRIIFLFTVWEKNLSKIYRREINGETKDVNEYTLSDYFPELRERGFLSIEETDKMIADVENKKEPGVWIEKLKDRFRIYKGEFCIFDIKTNKWESIDWDTGESTISDWSKLETKLTEEQRADLETIMREVDPKMFMHLRRWSSDNNYFSPDRKKCIYRTTIEMKHHHFPPLINIYEWDENIDELAICCLANNQKKLLGIRLHFGDYIYQIKWGHDNSFVFVKTKNLPYGIIVYLRQPPK